MAVVRKECVKYGDVKSRPRLCKKAPLAMLALVSAFAAFADHRGILSWASQPRDGSLREAGSYGCLVKAEIPKALVRDGKVTIRLEGDRGLAVYGPAFGRYPFGPHVK